MKMQAVQSALAIRRQRSRREDKQRAAARRESGVSFARPSPRPSVVSLDGHVYFNEKRSHKRMFGHVTMFHVGAVFIVIGLMLTITSLMPGYVKSSTVEQRNHLLGTGCVFVFVGGALTTVSRFVSNSQEEELNNYIKGRLSRSKSGHGLVRDAESGLPTPPRDRKLKNDYHGGHRGSHHGKNISVHKDQETPEVETHDDGHVEDAAEEPSCSGDVPPTDETSPVPTEMVLSQILEEDEASTEPLEDTTPESSLCSPMSPLETQGLLERHYAPPRRASSGASSRASSKASSVSSKASANSKASFGNTSMEDPS